MNARRSAPRLARDSLTQGFALLCLLLMGGWALAGPSGLLAWSENRNLLEQRRTEIAQLTLAHARLQNRVNLLNPQHADPDLTGELLRSKLNVAHPDEMVMLLH